jgi:hypothetical protein
VTQLARLIDQGRARPRVLEDHLLGTVDSAQIALTIETFVSDALGSISDALFYKTSVGVVVGFRMTSGRDVVVKVIQWGVSEERLTQVQVVQSHLAEMGLPAPKPLTAPAKIGNGFGVIEELKLGDEASGFDEDVRQSVAYGLRRFVETAQPLVGSVQVGTPLVLLDDYETLWPDPHDPTVDFLATAQGAEWIDEYGADARRVLTQATGALAIGHFDWRVQNLAFRGKDIVAIYDWDSLGLAPEAVIVGCAAASFSSTWSRPDVDTLPTLDQMRVFVEHYEVARGRTFDEAERRTLDAANLWLCAYGARCQHSRNRLDGGPLTDGGSSWMRLLRERGPRAFT